MVNISPSQRTIICDIAREFGAHDIRLFGSRARGTAEPTSDVDLLVRFDQNATLLTVIGFKQAVEEALEMNVDVVEEAGLSPFLARRIISEAKVCLSRCGVTGQEQPPVGPHRLVSVSQGSKSSASQISTRSSPSR